MSTDNKEGQENNQSSTEDHLAVERLLLCMEGVQKQDEVCFNEFYDLTINHVYGLAVRITQSAEEAEEVVSDVYFQVWEQACHYSAQKGSIMAWVLTICRSRSIDRIRKRKQSQLEFSGQEIVEPIDPASRPDYFLDTTQQNKIVNHALQNLSSTQRQLLSLAFFRGLTHQEIADLIDMPIGTVKSHIRRTIHQLKSESSLQYCLPSDSEQPHG